MNGPLDNAQGHGDDYMGPWHGNHTENFSSLAKITRPECITVLAHGLVKFVSAVAYHFCLNLPATSSQTCTGIIYAAQCFLDL